MKTRIWMYFLPLGILLYSVVASAAWPKYSARDLLKESALVGVFKAETVDPRAYDWDAKEERTYVRFSVEKLYYGESRSGEIEFMLPGGIAPDESEVVWTDTPSFTEGQSYLLFIRAGIWHVTPVVGGINGSFRKTTIEGKQVLVDNDGLVVMGIGEKGTRLGARVSTDAMDSGNQVRDQGKITSNASNINSRSSIKNSPQAKKILSELEVLIANFRRENNKRNTQESGSIFTNPSPFSKHSKDNVKNDTNSREVTQ